ncbi:MAG: hypothetical protein KF852_04130 [Saprospiraceae bacterium]|nr:hypothetical protein [Saprospiraceae bacterium]
MLNEPSILSANTYFWTPGSNADSRRRAEKKRLSEVSEYFRALGMRVETSGDEVTSVHPSGVIASFSYRESTKNVYKRLDVRKPNGSASNITLLRKLADTATVGAIQTMPSGRFMAKNCNYYL